MTSWNDWQVRSLLKLLNAEWLCCGDCWWQVCGNGSAEFLSGHFVGHHSQEATSDNFKLYVALHCLTVSLSRCHNSDSCSQHIYRQNHQINHHLRFSAHVSQTLLKLPNDDQPCQMDMNGVELYRIQITTWNVNRHKDYSTNCYYLLNYYKI